MLREGYAVTAAHEATHWWFRSRRELFLLQVGRAAGEVSRPGHAIRLLDYGCGTGFDLRFLEVFGEALGAEIADEALTDFRKSGGLPVLDLRTDLESYHGRFDIVTALDVLEHFEDDVAGLEEVGRFLAPHGQIVLTVPAYGWLWSGEDVVSQHRRRYTKRMLVETCQSAGFEVLYVSYFNLAILPAMAAVIWAKRLFSGQTPARSNVRATRPWLNRLLFDVTALEARWVGRERLALPAGASLVCRARARGAGGPG